MDAILYSLMTVMTQWMRPRYNARIQLLEAQIRMLRTRIETSRIVPTPAERAELLRLGATMWMEDEGIDPRFLIRDRDRKYPDEFNEFWKEAEVKPIKTPPRAPMANAFCECYIGTTKREVLNHFICFSRGQLDYILRVWLKHYHEQRPHRGVGRDNTVLDENFTPNSEGRVHCKTELGGILKSYYREAA